VKTEIFKTLYLKNTIGLNAVITFSNTHHKLHSKYCATVRYTTL